MTPPQTIAHYRITGKLGEGGMGAVYRATDTKLSRDVAIKVLPDTFANDPDRLARFTREAQVLASLNHPNIAAIYGVEERALVLELVEGPTLADRIAHGPIPLDEAIPIARQIAEALEYAHEKGIVHRDLKPANIKVTGEGRVKVLDFGLAKAMSSDTSTLDPASSPTLTMRATLAGMIMGTAAYMSPEQAKGKPVDRRADIWAFGVLVVEMLTGRQMYSAETVSEILAAVLTREPDLSGLPPATPTSIRRLLKRCLHKDSQRRLQAIGEARIALEEPAVDEPVSTVVSTRAPSRIPWIVAACLLAALALTGALLWQATRPVARPLVRLSVDLGPDADASVRSLAILSPDGSRLVRIVQSAAGERNLAIRRLDRAEATTLPGTEGAIDASFSPDGQWLAFFTEEKLKKISVSGGSPITLCDAVNGRGTSWGEDGFIIAGFGLVSELYRVPAAGGPPQAMPDTSGREVRSRRWPQHLPGGETVLYTRLSDAGAGWEDATLEVLNLKTGKAKIVASGGFFGRYLPTGHLIFAHQGGLWGQAFDPGALEVRGSPAQLLDDLAANVTGGIGRFAFARNGTLVYANGQAVAGRWTLVWLDRSGKTQPLAVPSALNYTPALSPDGKRLMVGVGTPGESDLWQLDLERNNFSRFTFNRKGNGYPVWTPDGKHVVYISRDPAIAIWWTRSDGGGEPQRLLESKTVVIPYSFSPDGRRLAFSQTSPETGGDLWTLPIDTNDPEHPKPGQPEVFLRTSLNEGAPAFSPDGRWIAYGVQESGRIEIFVRPFPGPGGRWQISLGGGDYPVWSRDGRALLFKTTDNRIMEASYRATGDSFTAERPRLWSEARFGSSGVDRGRPYDLSPDGKRLLIPLFPEQEARKGNVHVTFLLNFFDEVRRRIP